jgi:hypothetical protein
MLHAYAGFVPFERTNPGVFVIWSPISCMSSVRLLALSLRGIICSPYSACKIAEFNILLQDGNTCMPHSSVLRKPVTLSSGLTIYPSIFSL